MGQFVKEIQFKNLTDEIVKFYEAEGCQIVYKEESVEIWYKSEAA